MPKLTVSDVLRNKRKIEAAALQVFVKQGFHGTSIRDIANASGVSIGNIYNYYKTKEDLYKDLKSKLGNKLRDPKRGNWAGVDPALAFTSIYLQFFTYFLVETLFGGK